MSRQPRWALCILLLSFAATPGSARAGTFVMTGVSANIVTSSYGYIGVRVVGTAQYMGTVDFGDVDYQINTELNDNQDGGSLDNWSMPDAEGGGLTGSGIDPNMTITCSGSCSAYANLYRESCPATYNYKGHGAVTIYHPFLPEIDTMDTGLHLVGCFTYTPPDGGGGGGGGRVGGCSGTVVGATTTTSLVDGSLLDKRPGTYPLSRRDVQGHVRYLLDDWAVLSASPAARGGQVVETLNASSAGFAKAAAAGLRAGLPMSSTGPVLVVEAPVHPKNTRWIPTPEVALRGGAFADGSAFQELAVRADFDASGTLVEVEPIYPVAGVPEALLAELRSRLTMVYQGDKRHRAISFMVLDLGDRVKIRSSVTILPQCCCGTDEPFCV